MSPTLPVHFIWSDGSASCDLSQLRDALANRREEASWHLAEGHLQHALADQGYRAVVEDCAKPKHLELLAQRVEVVLTLAPDAGVERFARAIAEAKLFKKGKAELTVTGRKALADALGQDEPKGVKKAVKRAAEQATDRIAKAKKAPAKKAPAKKVKAGGKKKG